MKLKHSLLALGVAAALCSPAFAGNDVTYTYAGVVDSDEAERGWIAFTGQFTFDRMAIDQIADPSTGDYKMNTWPNGMNVVFDGSTAFSFNNFFDILISNDLGGADQFGAQAHDAGSSDSLGLTLTDFTHGVFASDALPLPMGGLTLAMFRWSEFKYESSGGLLSGHLTAFSCTAGCSEVVVTPPVPEPSTWALMFGGLFALGTFVRGRASASR